MGFDLEFLDALDLPPDRVSQARGDRAQYATDYGTQAESGTLPDAVVTPRSTEDVATVLRAANERHIPVTPYAAGTSTEGHAVPDRGGITLDLTDLDRIVEVRPEDLQIDVEAGVIGSSVDGAAEPHGLFFPPLPSSGDISTVGGMIANDASGMRTVKYGEVREWVRELEVVLADGSVITTGTRAPKTSSGYNVKDVMVGSEGTLGVVTRATLELGGLPAEMWGGRAEFESTEAAATAIADGVKSGVDLATVELMDPLSTRIANAYSDTEVPERPLVFFEIHANHGIEEEVEFCRTVFAAHGMESFEVASDRDRFAELWEARRELGHALTAYDPGLRMLTVGDIAVPISEYAAMIRHAKTIGDQHDLLIPCFGHGGDGNVHYTILVDRENEESLARGRAAADALLEKALELGGTVTGEHGIGTRKRRYLRSEHGDRQVELMRGLKQVFDPNGILNPGTALPNVNS